MQWNEVKWFELSWVELHESMNDCMFEWKEGRKENFNEWTNKGTKEGKNEQTNEWMNEWVSEYMSEWESERCKSQPALQRQGVCVCDLGLIDISLGWIFHFGNAR